MNRIWALARHYPIVAVTVLVGLVVGGCCSPMTLPQRSGSPVDSR